ncbi:Transferase, partial [Trema orientale]
MAVKIVDVCMVAPSPAATPDHSCSTLPLTFYDLQMLRSPLIQRLYCYQNSKTTSFFDSILPKLIHSLSHTLQHFLPLAGNLTWPRNSNKPVVVYVEGDA